MSRKDYEGIAKALNRGVYYGRSGRAGSPDARPLPNNFVTGFSTAVDCLVDALAQLSDGRFDAVRFYTAVYVNSDIEIVEEYPNEI